VSIFVGLKIKNLDEKYKNRRFPGGLRKEAAVAI